MYKDRPIWEAWRRNLVKVSYKWQPPLRLFCIDRNGRFNVNHACPICRDEYFFFHYEVCFTRCKGELMDNNQSLQNPRLLQHFVKPGTDQPISNMKTGLCQEQQINLQAQVLKAREYGTMLHNVEFRHFDYTEWYPGLQPKFGVAEQPPSRHAQIDEIYPNPDIHFEPHNRDYNTNWYRTFNFINKIYKFFRDEWWIRHEKFTRKGR